MAYLSRHGYHHDIFVSYSHGDVEGSGHSLLKTWTKQFFELLRENLALSLERAPSMFFDEGSHPAEAVDPLAPLNEHLTKAVEGSALLQVLMSPHYLRSTW